MTKVVSKQKSRFKIQRYLGVELPGLGKAGALERRPYRPGQHGNQRKKLSDYAVQLLEKQKLRYHYGLREYQLVNLVKKVKKIKGRAWIDSLVITLEQRLDNVIFRGQFANSMASSRQMITHGQVRVNGKKVTAPGLKLKIDDVVTLTPKGYAGQTFASSQTNPRLPDIPAYISVIDSSEKQLKLIAEPLALDIPFEFDARLVTDYYSNIKK